MNPDKIKAAIVFGIKNLEEIAIPKIEVGLGLSTSLPRSLELLKEALVDLGLDE